MNYDYNTYADVQAATNMFAKSFILIVTFRSEVWVGYGFPVVLKGVGRFGM